jgi:tRNA wybutosine-synthesizing protein 2
LDTDLWPWRQQIGFQYLTFLTEFETIIHKVGVTTSSIRTPHFEILAGKTDTVTLHKELSCKFWIDALRLTFSTGNHSERQRLINEVKAKEKIIDMFACVGNLSLPIGVHHPQCQIQGIEVNPYAFKFLTRNIQINHLEGRYKAILGDNRNVTPKNWADRVLMGFFDITTDHLRSALQSLKQEQGGIIHIHGLDTTKQPLKWDEQLEPLLVENLPHFQLKSKKRRNIKTVASGVHHFVEDIVIECKT